MQSAKPDLAADKMERFDACPSAFVREWEAAEFAQRHGLRWPNTDEPDAKRENERALRLAEVVAAIPFYSAARGVGSPIDVQKVATKAAARIDAELRPGDMGFIMDTVRKRDALIERLISQAATARGQVELELNFEPKQLQAQWGEEGVTGLVNGNLAGGYVVAKGNRGSHVLLLDYTTGFAPPAEPKKAHEGIQTNRHFMTLAALAAIWRKAVGEDIDDLCVHVALLHRNDTEVDTVTSIEYDPTMLRSAMRWLNRTAAARVRQAGEYEAGRDADGTPAPEQAAVLDAKAVVGKHCKQCPGSICCARLTREMRREASAAAKLIAPEQLVTLRKQVKATSAAVSRNKEKELTPQHLQTLPMNIATLAETLDAAKTLRDGLALPDKVWDDATDLVRLLNERGVAVPGWELEAGASRFNFRKEMPVAGAGKGKTVAVRDADLTPPGLYKALRPVLGGMSYEEFVARACSVEAAKLRGLVGDLHGVSAESAYERVLAPKLEDKNPCEMRPNKPSVVRAQALANAAPLPEAAKSPAAVAKR